MSLLVNISFNKDNLGCHFHFLQVLGRLKDIKGSKVINDKNEKLCFCGLTTFFFRRKEKNGKKVG
jgi:hypothetical protein